MSLGALDITLAARGPAPRWHFAPVAGPDVERHLVGRTAGEAAQMLPRIFNLCAAAHAGAAHAALGLPASAVDAARREAAAREECRRDHARAVLAEWPALVGGALDRDGLRLLAAPDRAALRHHLLGADLDLAGATPATLEAWLVRGASPVARLLRRIRQQVRPEWGRVDLDQPDADDIVATLETGAPGAARETTALDRWRQAPLIGALRAGEGTSLFVRLLARLLELVAGLDDGDPPPPLPPGLPPGIGLARAARGLLAHRACLREGRVFDYRIVPPSAWNLAPGGLLARMLAALPLGAQTPMLARIALAGVNPCVPVRLRFEAREGVCHA
ncbi:hypothetical protein [Ancylobacter terrae]|uniref:hypothetical protein n=1 Tax=Ancylobacter sp. sgz301288 TaxID=3342077 RepID=UPI00385ED768